MSKVYSASVIILALFVISCSTTKQATQKKSSPDQNSIYPEWYSASDEFTRSPDSSSYHAYGMAVATDSSTAVAKARTKAASNLERHISSALESIRKKAGSDVSDLNTPEFIFALRKVEATVSKAASSTQSSVRRDPKYGSYQGFAEVTITREALVEKLGSQFTGDKKSWNALKASGAFKEL